MALESKKKLHKLKMPAKRAGGLSMEELQAMEDKDAPMDTPEDDSQGDDRDAYYPENDEKFDDQDDDQNGGPDQVDGSDMQLSDEHSSPALEHVPDEELLAELKKRGLMSQLDDSHNPGLEDGDESDSMSDRSNMGGY